MAIETPPLATGPSTPGPKPPRRWLWLVCALILGLAGASVFVIVARQSPGNGEVEPGASVAPQAKEPDDAAIVKAYLDGWTAWEEVTSNLTESPEVFSATAVDPLLNFLRVQVADLRAKGVYYEKGGITHTNLQVVEHSADRALLRACMLDKTYGYNAKGERLPAPGLPGERTSMEAIAIRDSVSGVWKISSRYPQKTGGGACGD